MKSFKERFIELDNKRKELLDRARKCAELTLPYILPPENTDSTTKLSTPYQSLGARGVNNIAAKLTLGLLPPNAPFFKLTLGEDTDSDTEVEKALVEVENMAGKVYVDRWLLRNTLHTALQHAAITGNSMFFIGEKNSKVYPLDQWVKQRDGEGNLIELIIKENYVFTTLPKEWQQRLIKEGKVSLDENGEYVKVIGQGGFEKPNNIEVYTRATFDKNKNQWVVQEEVEGIKGKQKFYKKNEFPFFVIRWHSLAGDPYGRGIVEQYLGSLITLEALYKALSSGAIQSSRVIWLVSPESVLQPKDIEEAFDGDVKIGNATDVTAIQLNKYADFQWILTQVASLEEALSRDFLMVNGIVRDAERVTAEEIRTLTQELENTLGGVYSLFSQELLKPLANFLITKYAKENNPELLNYFEEFDIQIITGLNAVGRGEDFNRLVAFLNTIQALPDALSYIDLPTLLNKLVLSIGIDKNIIKSQEQLQQEQQQMQMMQLMSMMGQSQGGMPQGGGGGVQGNGSI